MEIRMEALTSREIEERINQGTDIAVFPIGSVEQHGQHCPVGTDGIISLAIARGVAEKLGALCLPPLWYGMSSHHMAFPGTLTIRPEVLGAVVEDVLESLIHHGIKNILILNGHGGNTASISSACAKVRYRHPGVFLAQSSVWLALNDVYEGFPPEVRQESWPTMVAHGGLFETSAVMAVDEGMVKMDRARSAPVDKHVLATDPVMSVTVRMQELSDWGSDGDPRGSTPELGKMFLEKSIEIIGAKYGEAIKNFPTID